MADINLNTQTVNTWCPGCTNFIILAGLKSVIQSLINKGYDKDKFVIAAGIGCHGKLPDYLNVSSIMSLHGRDVATAEGIKIAKPELTVIAIAGDGDAYAEGIEHLIHAAKRNSDITLFVHNNQVFGLTTGQVTPTSPKGYRGRSTPGGSIEEPLNPLMLMLSAGASFVARASTLDPEGMKKIMAEAIQHKGFSIVDIIQPCITFADTRQYFKENCYNLDASWPTANFDVAIKKINENIAKIGLGIFYKEKKPTFEDQL